MRWLVLLLLLLPQVVFGEISYTSAGGNGVASGTTISWTQNASTDSKIIFTVRMNTGAYIADFAYGGTSYGGSAHIKYLENGTHKMYLWVVSPTFNGARNVTITASSSCEMSGGSIRYTNVAAVVTPVATFNAAARSVTIPVTTSQNNSWITGFSGYGTGACASYTSSMPVGQTIRTTSCSGGTYISSLSGGDLITTSPASYTWITHWNINSGQANIGMALELIANTETVTPTITQTATQTVTATVTQTNTQTVTQTVTQTTTQTSTETITQTATETNTQTVTQTSTQTITQTNTQTVTGTNTQTVTQTVTPTVTQTATPTATQTVTPQQGADKPNRGCSNPRYLHFKRVPLTHHYRLYINGSKRYITIWNQESQISTPTRFIYMLCWEPQFKTLRLTASSRYGEIPVEFTTSRILRQ